MLRSLSFAILLSVGSGVALAQSVAVLPFANTSAASVPGVSNLDWIGESVAETVRESLAVRSVLGFDRGNIEEAFRGLRLRHADLSAASILKIGEALDADQILYGTFVFTPSEQAVEGSADASAPQFKGTLKFTAKLLDRRRLRESELRIEEGALEDLGHLEAHLAWQVLKQIDPKVAPAETEVESMRLARRLDAEENYIRGLLTPSVEQKQKFFRQAAMLDPKFSHACLQLGTIYHARKQYRDAADWLERVSSTAAHYRESQFLLGLSRYALGDFAAAQKAFQGIAEVVPLSEVYNNLAAAESRRNLAQATEDFRKALEGDQNDPDYHFNLGYSLLKHGDFGGAADQFRAVLARNPEDSMATLLLGRSLKKQSLRAGPADARYQALERLKTVYEERPYWQLKSMIESKQEK